jgi:hypothetical protein
MKRAAASTAARNNGPGGDSAAGASPLTTVDRILLSAVPPVSMSPDQICGLVAQEPEVREAAIGWDRAIVHGVLVA